MIIHVGSFHMDLDIFPDALNNFEVMPHSWMRYAHKHIIWNLSLTFGTPYQDVTWFAKFQIIETFEESFH